MRYRPVIDARKFSPYATSTEGPLWWGMLAMIAIETAVVVALIVSYFFLKTHNDAWPLGGYDVPKLLLPTINTFVLIASSLVMHWADVGAKMDDQRRLRVGMVVATTLGALFLTLKVVEYSQVPYKWDSNAYGSIVWLIIGFHSAHVLILLMKASIVTTMAFRGFFTPRRRLGVVINGLYWHFVVIIWLPLYFVLYWTPRF